MPYLYDPRTNIITETTYDYLMELTGLSRSGLSRAKSKGRKIRKINCYVMDTKVSIKQRKTWYEKEEYNNEAWKEIKGSNGQYLLSNYGRFKRLYKTNTAVVLPYLHKKTGYLRVKVMFQGKYAAYNVMSLVGFHFIEGPKPGEVIRHKNGIKTDDFAGNLEYVSKKILAKSTGPMSKSKPVVQLDKDTLEIIGEYRSAREAGRKCYLSYQAVLDNCNHKSKTSGGFIFMFSDEYESKFDDMEDDY